MPPHLPLRCWCDRPWRGRGVAGTWEQALVLVAARARVTVALAKSDTRKAEQDSILAYYRSTCEECESPRRVRRLAGGGQCGTRGLPQGTPVRPSRSRTVRAKNLLEIAGRDLVGVRRPGATLGCRTTEKSLCAVEIRVRPRSAHVYGPEESPPTPAAGRCGGAA